MDAGFYKYMYSTWASTVLKPPISPKVRNLLFKNLSFIFVNTAFPPHVHMFYLTMNKIEFLPLTEYTSITERKGSA